LRSPPSKAAKPLGGYASDFSSRDFSANLTRIQSPSTSNAVVTIGSGQPPSGSAQFSSLIIEGFSISGGSRGISTDLYLNCWGASCASPLLALTVRSCILENNGSSTGGGGIALGHGSQLLNSVVRNNKGARGAGISGGGVNVLIENALIEDNLAHSDHGGGVYMSVNNRVTFRNNIVRRNVVGVGATRICEAANRLKRREPQAVASLGDEAQGTVTESDAELTPWNAAVTVVEPEPMAVSRPWDPLAFDTTATAGVEDNQVAALVRSRVVASS
jgi:hypothetical protein